MSFFCLDFEKIQREEALDLPPVPPQGRNWKGSVVAPFAGNNMLVLYQCTGKISDGSMISGGQNNSYFIQVLHNEASVSMPVRLLTFFLFFIQLFYPCFQDIIKFVNPSFIKLHFGVFFLVTVGELFYVVK